MEEPEEVVPFIAKLRSAGKSKSLIMTVPKEICDVHGFKDGDYIHVKIKKVRLEKL